MIVYWYPCIILIYGDSIKEASKDVDSSFPLNSNHSLFRSSVSAFFGDSSMENHDVCLYHLTSHALPSLFDPWCAKPKARRG